MKNLKSIMLGLMFTVIASLSFAQDDSVYVQKMVDDMSEKVYYFPSRKMVCATQDKKTGFTVSVFIDKKGDGVVVSDLNVKMVNIGSCVENNEMIIMFEDETKISLKSWNEFNCKGDAWFKTSKSDREKLATLRIKKIKVQNGRTYESYTYELTDDEDYFIQLFYATANNKIKLVKEEK